MLEKATFAESVDFVYFVYFKYVVLFSFSKEFAFIFIFHIGLIRFGCLRNNQAVKSIRWNFGARDPSCCRSPGLLSPRVQRSLGGTGFPWRPGKDWEMMGHLLENYVIQRFGIMEHIEDLESLIRTTS